MKKMIVSTGAKCSENNGMYIASFSNGYEALVAPCIAKGLWEVTLTIHGIPCSHFENDDLPIKVNSLNGYLTKDEVEFLLYEIADLPTAENRKTVFPVSKSGIPLEELVRPYERPIQRLKIENVTSEELSRLEDSVKGLYTFDEESNSYYLAEKEWLECRRHGEYPDPTNSRYIDVAIGGSSVSALFEGSELAKELQLYEGQHGSKYQSAIELFYEKTGQEFKLKEEENEDVFFVGHTLEPAVAKYFKRKYLKDHPDDSLRIINDTHMYQCGRRDKNGILLHPYVLCDLDRTIVLNGIKGVLELKTCQWSSPDRPLWEAGIVPLKYYLQVVWYMASRNVPFAYIACMLGTSADDIVYIYIERDFEIEEAVLKMVGEFVQNVRTGKEPDLEGQDLDRLYAFWRMKMGPYKPQADFVKLDDSLLPSVEKLLAIKSEMEIYEGKLKELKQKQKELLVSDIFPVFGDSNKGNVKIDEGSWYEITLRAKPRSAKIDEARLKADHPDIYERYTTLQSASFFKKISLHPDLQADYLKAHPSKFETTKFAKEHPDLYAEYFVPDGKLTETKMNHLEILYKEKFGWRKEKNE